MSSNGSSANEELPIRVGEYELLLELGSGGMATVYAARQVGDGGFERLVAIKRVHRHLVKEADAYDGFCDEARIAALVRHANVVPVISVVDTRGELLLVQEYVDGVTLSALLRRARKQNGELLPRVGIGILCDALRGLHAAHEARDMRGQPLALVHRDFTPQNILVGCDGGGRLIDFGVARAESRISTTKSGVVKGKFQYMSPEQVNAEEVTRASDVFAAGVVLCEILTGERPFDGSDDQETLVRILAGTSRVRPTFFAKLPDAYRAIVERCLAHAPADRFETALDLCEALEEAATRAPVREVARVVDELFHDDIEDWREAIRASLGSDLDDGRLGQLGLGSVAPPPPTPIAARLASELVDSSDGTTVDRARRPSRRSGSYTLAALGAVALVGVAFVALRRGDGAPPTDAGAENPPEAPTVAALSSAPESSTPESSTPESSTPESSARTPVATSSAPTAAPSASMKKPPKTNGSVGPKAPSSATAPKPGDELQDDPYAKPKK